MSYQVTVDEFESLRIAGFSTMQVRDLCIRLMDTKKDTDDFKAARQIVETVYNTHKAYIEKKKKKQNKGKIAKQGQFSIGSYKYKAR